MYIYADLEVWIDLTPTPTLLHKCWSLKSDINSGYCVFCVSNGYRRIKWGLLFIGDMLFCRSSAFVWNLIAYHRSSAKPTHMPRHFPTPSTWTPHYQNQFELGRLYLYLVFERKQIHRFDTRRRVRACTEPSQRTCIALLETQSRCTVHLLLFHQPNSIKSR